MGLFRGGAKCRPRSIGVGLCIQDRVSFQANVVPMMCRSDPSFTALKNVLAEQSPFGPGVASPAAALAEYQRLQIYDYGRLRFHPFGIPYGLAGAFPDATTGQYGFANPFVRFDPRAARFATEEPKPQHSYIGLIAMAILSIPDKKMVLSDIYQYILDQYPYFRNRGPGWRNSIRHNLSLNDCFIKAGRSANGKGHYWAIHPANIEDFKKGDFRRRKAQRKVRKHMGLAVPDDDDSPAPTPPPRPPLEAPTSLMESSFQASQIKLLQQSQQSPPKVGRQKRQFDMESLLAPDPPHSSGSPTLDSPRSYPHSPGGGSESPKESVLPQGYFSPSSRRSAMQWTAVSLPIQGLPQRMNSFAPFAAPCWPQAAALLTYSRGAPQDISPTNHNPLVHRWQESVNRATLDSDKVIEQ